MVHHSDSWVIIFHYLFDDRHCLICIFCSLHVVSSWLNSPIRLEFRYATH
jgi:hypothetical protein